ncbi:hypothetical protein JEQ12_010745 [Ovis aries]|uniref:Uncharacterized protein n=1 Tax=Ovis aries TaxID=9940 RepID=A0A836CVR3_SHEEP|nr:hypothetical protein JEQ12_010745 [Ovis aries]
MMDEACLAIPMESAVSVKFELKCKSGLISFYKMYDVVQRQVEDSFPCKISGCGADFWNKVFLTDGLGHHSCHKKSMKSESVLLSHIQWVILLANKVALGMSQTQKYLLENIKQLNMILTFDDLVGQPLDVLNDFELLCSGAVTIHPVDSHPLVVSEIYMDDGIGIGWVVGAEWSIGNHSYVRFGTRPGPVCKESSTLAFFPHFERLDALVCLFTMTLIYFIRPARVTTEALTPSVVRVTYLSSFKRLGIGNSLISLVSLLKCYHKTTRMIDELFRKANRAEDSSVSGKCKHAATFCFARLHLDVNKLQNLDFNSPFLEFFECSRVNADNHLRLLPTCNAFHFEKIRQISQEAVTRSPVEPLNLFFASDSPRSDLIVKTSVVGLEWLCTQACGEQRCKGRKNVFMLLLRGSDVVAMVLCMQYPVAEEKEPNIEFRLKTNLGHTPVLGTAFPSSLVVRTSLESSVSITDVPVSFHCPVPGAL